MGHEIMKSWLAKVGLGKVDPPGLRYIIFIAHTKLESQIRDHHFDKIT